jgi:hypothetical protein
VTYIFFYIDKSTLDWQFWTDRLQRGNKNINNPIVLTQIAKKYSLCQRKNSLAIVTIAIQYIRNINVRISMAIITITIQIPTLTLRILFRKLMVLGLLISYIL